MKIVYFSHAGNTHRFVHNRLLPALKDSPFNWDDGQGYKVPTVRRLEAAGPQRTSDEYLKEHSDEKLVVVFPIYARGDFATGGVKDTVPQVIKQYVEANRSQVIAALVSGNRTFGPKFGYVDPDELAGIPVLHVFELSGTRLDAVTARTLLHLEAKATKKEEEVHE